MTHLCIVGCRITQVESEPVQCLVSQERLAERPDCEVVYLESYDGRMTKRSFEKGEEGGDVLMLGLDGGCKKVLPRCVDGKGV